MQGTDSVSGVGVAARAGMARPPSLRDVVVGGLPLLNAAARFWFLVATLGQWLFVVYIVVFYGLAVVTGDLARWGKFLTHGLMPGDTVGNFALATHLAMAAIITACGPLQLIPQLRARFPRVHRWTGRVYLVTALAASTSALYLLWIRNERVAGDLVQHLGISVDAVLIGVCAALALRYALQRRFDLHRRWDRRASIRRRFRGRSWISAPWPIPCCRSPCSKCIGVSVSAAAARPARSPRSGSLRSRAPWASASLARS